MKQNIYETFNDPTWNKEINILNSLGKGLVFHFYGDKSEESVDIKFSNKDLMTH